MPILLCSTPDILDYSTRKEKNSEKIMKSINKNNESHDNLEIGNTGNVFLGGQRLQDRLYISIYRISIFSKLIL